MNIQHLKRRIAEIERNNPGNEYFFECVRAGLRAIIESYNLSDGARDRWNKDNEEERRKRDEERMKRFGTTKLNAKQIAEEKVSKLPVWLKNLRTRILENYGKYVYMGKKHGHSAKYPELSLLEFAQIGLERQAKKQRVVSAESIPRQARAMLERIFPDYLVDEKEINDKTHEIQMKESGLEGFGQSDNDKVPVPEASGAFKNESYVRVMRGPNKGVCGEVGKFLGDDEYEIILHNPFKIITVRGADLVQCTRYDEYMSRQFRELNPVKRGRPPKGGRKLNSPKSTYHPGDVVIFSAYGKCGKGTIVDYDGHLAWIRPADNGAVVTALPEEMCVIESSYTEPETPSDPFAERKVSKAKSKSMMREEDLPSVVERNGRKFDVIRSKGPSKFNGKSVIYRPQMPEPEETEEESKPRGPKHPSDPNIDYPYYPSNRMKAGELVLIHGDGETPDEIGYIDECVGEDIDVITISYGQVVTVPMKTSDVSKYLEDVTYHGVTTGDFVHITSGGCEDMYGEVLLVDDNGAVVRVDIDGDLSSDEYIPFEDIEDADV